MLERGGEAREPLFADPGAEAFFRVNCLPLPAAEASFEGYWRALPIDRQEHGGWTLESLREGLHAFLSARDHVPHPQCIDRLEVVGGRDKSGAQERLALCFRPGEVICLVGPTGSGKSRFLADIECMAQGDTPSQRTLLIDGRPPDPECRFNGERRIVAQITQNMNFVMDLSVIDFLRLHAESRALTDPEATVQRVLEAAIEMAGEPFGAATPLTQLSGGQSRALMIADAAHLSPKPVVLIDEIENAGVDRIRALQLFVERGKIVFLSTHDPLLALSGTRRLVIRNGAVCDAIEPTPRERGYAQRLAALDRHLTRLREAVRGGDDLDAAWRALGPALERLE